MDIPRIPELNVTQNHRNASTFDIFKQLTQLGTIEARVAAISRGQAILLTQIGQIPTKNSLNLKVGDIIQIRTNGNEQNPVLKVNAGVDKTVILDSVKHSKLAQQIPVGKPVSAILIGQQTSKAQIKVGNQIFTIPRQAELKPGQLISLVKIASSNTIEIKTVDHHQVLKSAMSKLLPQQQASHETSGLTRLVKLVQTISSSIPASSNQTTPGLTDKATTSTLNLPARIPASVKSNITPMQPGIGQKQAPTSVINPLNNLLASIPAISKLDKSTLEHWINRLLTPEPVRQSSQRLNTQQLLQHIPKTEASLVQLLQKITQQAPGQAHNGNSAIAAEGNKSTDEPLQLFARDIIKLVEQSGHQQLLQQTNLRYQQELQQPIVLNLTIPVNEDQKTRELRLKIQQKNPENETHKQSWDIHFDFEFGLLGLISTHLVLDENTLSASFWSERTDTQNKIDNGLDIFKHQLQRAGFEIGQFYSFAGRPPQQDNKVMVPSSESLLDIKV